MCIRYLGATVTNQITILEGNLNQVKSEECLLNSVQKLLPSFLSEEVMIEIYKTNFAYSSLLVYHNKEGTQNKGV
jgi:hypothetical protein